MGANGGRAGILAGDPARSTPVDPGGITVDAHRAKSPLGGCPLMERPLNVSRGGGTRREERQDDPGVGRGSQTL